MADRAASKTMLGLLGFSEEAANKIYDVQGINAISEWKEMDDEAITTLCKVLRRPGGTAAGGGADPGVMVSARAETNLKLAVFFMKHQERVSRGVQWSDVTLSEIRKLSRQREMEDKTSDSGTADTPKVDPKDWSKTMESLVEYLATFRGVTGVPLSYVVRKELIPKTAASDPPTNYNTLDEEMIARAPIMATANASEDGPFVDTFIIDRVKVWEKLSVLMISAEAWTYFKIGRKSKDGRKAFLAVDGHYLGPNNVDHLARSAERKLHNLAYRSERKGWNFEKYVTAHKEQHTILQGLEEHGYKGIDERSKVRYLQDGIKTDRLDAVKSTILSSAEYRGDFAKCVTLYKDFLQQSDEPAELKIAEVGIEDGGGAEGVTDRYYSKQEYATLSNAQKKKLKQLRAKRKGAEKGNSGGGGGGGGGSESQVEKLKKKLKRQANQISALTVKIKKVKTSGADADDESSSSDEKEESATNRGHSALTRQSSRKK